ncbi:MAG: NAD(P)H-binding protein [Phycisphaerae bacterium]|nr:NAD(P)H-binding protein [Phycisphaerae bacterium]
MSTPHDITVAIVGATGFVGRHVTRALLAQGHAVRTLVRDRDKARAVLPPGASWVFGDATSRTALNELMTGANAVVNCVGIRREWLPDVTFENAHQRTTRACIEAAESAGVARFIQISALGTRPNAPTAYHRSKHEAEQFVRRSRLDWTILRPSLIHGPDGEFMKIVKDWTLGRSAPFFVLPYFARVAPPAGFPPIPKPESARLQPVHVDDVAGAVVACLRQAEAIGEVYPSVGPDIMDWPQLLATIRDSLPLSDGKKKIVPLPGVLASAFARAAEAVGLGAALPFGPSEPIMAIEDNTAALDKARHQLAIHPRPFAASLRQYAAQV